MWTILIAAAILIGITIIESDAFIIGLILSGVSLGICWGIADTKITTDEVITQPIVLQEIEGELLIPQKNLYVLKFDREVKIKSKSDIYTFQSDSVYEEIQWNRKIKDYSRCKRWIPGMKTIADTTDTFKQINLYRNLN
jgi:hypothetical protein